MGLIGSGSVHYAGRYRHQQGKKGFGSSHGGTNPTCQRCLQTGHWTYECPNEPTYQSRPTKTQQLLNPKLQPHYLSKNELPPDLQDDIVQGRKRRRQRGHSSSSRSSGSSGRSNGGDSTATSSSSSSSSSESDTESSSSDRSTSSYSTSGSESDTESSSGDSSSSSDSTSTSTHSSSSDDSKQRNKKHARVLAGPSSAAAIDEEAEKYYS